MEPCDDDDELGMLTAFQHSWRSYPGSRLDTAGRSQHKADVSVGASVSESYRNGRTGIGKHPPLCPAKGLAAPMKRRAKPEPESIRHPFALSLPPSSSHPSSTLSPSLSSPCSPRLGSPHFSTRRDGEHSGLVAAQLNQVGEQQEEG
ncbi:hypothetical protein L3Q82_009793 [Scortum barcoo]|uniref:Uncharacterized protein n=1 Tax=Scortum barcoo TaxID=214431 RepID=A0ACB8WE10_9TELE|nr:hypothetical protein L3Q82_009793 [Scortum barcoo]